MRSRTLGFPATALLAGAALLLAGCGGSDGAEQAVQAEPAAATVPAPPAPARQVRFTGTDYAFRGPASVAAGRVELTLENAGQVGHQLALYRVNDGADAGAALNAITAAGHLEAGREFGVWLGGPNGVAAGKSGSVVADLQPGSYLVACLMPASDGQPHAAKGMLAKLEVTPAKEAAGAAVALPEVELHEFSFALPERFGTTSVNVVNKGSMVHELDIVRLHDRVSIDDVLLYEKQRATERPYDDVGGTTMLDPGEVQRLDLDLPPGDYAAICFLPTPEHAAHFTLGMIKRFHVD
jgi:uncharacterized cupredoxin-like copper-binding protein